MLTNSRRFTVSNCIGIDVSKATINVHISKNNQDLVFDNNLKSFKHPFFSLSLLLIFLLHHRIFLLCFDLYFEVHTS